MAYFQEYKDHKITFDTEKFDFVVSGPHFEDGKWSSRFDDVKKARDEIESRLKASAKQSKLKMNLKALDWNGEWTTIKGIHSTTGELLGANGGSVYPPVLWLQTELQRHAAIRKEMEAIDRKVRPYSINTRRTYGRIPAATYDQHVESVEAEFASKTKLAEEKKAA